MTGEGQQEFTAAPSPGSLNVLPPDVFRRRADRWHGLAAETCEMQRLAPVECNATSARHLFTFAERAVRRDGETRIDTLPPSSPRDFSQTLCIVPAGCRFEGWQIPRIPLKTTYIYIDTDWPLLDPALRAAEITFAPRLFVSSLAIEPTVLKLKALIGRRMPADRLYAEALGAVLQHELLRFVSGREPIRAKGGLAPWQERRVRDFIEANLASPIPVSLALLAAVTGLSVFHFAHAFKISFGMPPHRYLSSRRIARAKELLRNERCSVAEIAFGLGFSDASAFTASFRKATGLSPSDYRRQNRG